MAGATRRAWKVSQRRGKIAAIGVRANLCTLA